MHLLRTVDICVAIASIPRAVNHNSWSERLDLTSELGVSGRRVFNELDGVHHVYEIRAAPRDDTNRVGFVQEETDEV
jgi:hypothetical protein